MELRWDRSAPPFNKLFGKELVNTLNQVYTRQIRLGFLIEQIPDPGNRVQISDKYKDKLGLPRPLLTYRIASEYEREAFLSAKEITTELFKKIGATEYTQTPRPPVFRGDPDSVTSTNFQYADKNGALHNFKFYGAGHIAGTYRMGTDPSDSVLNKRQQSWDHKNLFMVGSGVFPTIGTANPTLTIAALAFQAADNILDDLE